jgi:hypothetical protein
MKKIFNANYMRAKYGTYSKSAHKMLTVNCDKQPNRTYRDLIIKAVGTVTVVIVEQILKGMCMGYI